ncbi:MAG: hypothetical protein ABEJ27_00990 [Halodesulfurarchaeum sp.]
MSTTATQTVTSLTPKQERLLEYLRSEATETTYFKSRLIGDELGLSAKEVGTNMPAVADAASDLEIEKWGYSAATTWKVTV